MDAADRWWHRMKFVPGSPCDGSLSPPVCFHHLLIEAHASILVSVFLLLFFILVRIGRKFWDGQRHRSRRFT